MSGSVGYATTAFTDAERVDIRRFLGYPAYGVGNAGFQGWRFFQAYGLLEYRLTNLGPSEFQVSREFLAKLYPLKDAIDSASSNLDTDQAAVWYHNKNEVADRASLYRMIRMEFAAFLGVPLGDGLRGGNSVRLVV